MASWKDPTGAQNQNPVGTLATPVHRESVAGSTGGVELVQVRNQGDLFRTETSHPMQQLAQAGVAILTGAAYPYFPSSHRASPSGVVRIQRTTGTLPASLPDAIFPFIVGWQAWQVCHPILTRYGRVGGQTRPVAQAVAQLEVELEAALVAAGYRIPG